MHAFELAAAVLALAGVGFWLFSRSGGSLEWRRAASRGNRISVADLMLSVGWRRAHAHLVVYVTLKVAPEE